MKKVLTFVFILYSILGFSQSHNIKFRIRNYTNDTLLLAYFYGEQQLVKDTLYSIKPNYFEYKGDSLIHPGSYIALVYPSKEYFQFLVGEKDQKFSIETDYTELQKIKVKGSKENKLFFKYLDYIKDQNKVAQDLLTKRKDFGEDSIKVDSIDNILQKLNNEVGDYQLGIMKKYPETITSLLIKMNRDIEIPDFDGSEEEVKMKRYQYYRKHYFDNIDLKNPSILYTPDIHNKIVTYVDKLTVPHADSINNSIDTILGKMSPGSDIWQYYVSFFLNKYAKSNIIGMDAVYVHMVQNYYAKGLTPWVEEKALLRIIDNAIRMESVLIGKEAPKLKLYKEDGSPVSLRDIKAKYTVLMFWKPDCGHCKRSMPSLLDFADKYKSQGVEVVAICTKLGKKVKQCWDGVKELKMDSLKYNLGDSKNLSGFHANYNIRATPTVFILDKDKKILIKQIPTDKLGEIMDSIIEEEKINNHESK